MFSQQVSEATGATIQRTDPDPDPDPGPDPGVTHPSGGMTHSAIVVVGTKAQTEAGCLYVAMLERAAVMVCSLVICCDHWLPKKHQKKRGGKERRKRKRNKEVATSMPPRASRAIRAP